MLFMLTGEVQTGKTRWLQRLTSQLSREGVTCSGVLAPGVWRRRAADESWEEPARDGLVQCPSAHPSQANDTEAASTPLSAFGFCGGSDRKDAFPLGGLPLSAPVQGLAGSGEFEKLGIENVLLPGGERILFARRRDLSQKAGTFDPSSQSAAAQLAWDISDAALARVNDHFASLAGCARDASVQRGLLVVDELGRLELMRGGGLTQAVSLLEAGPTPAFPHAVIVVRAALAELARERFASSWGGCQAVLPDDVGSAAVCAACGA